MHAKQNANSGASYNEQSQRQPDCDPFADPLLLRNIIDSWFCGILSTPSWLVGLVLTSLVGLTQRSPGFLGIIVMPASSVSAKVSRGDRGRFRAPIHFYIILRAFKGVDIGSEWQLNWGKLALHAILSCVGSWSRLRISSVHKSPIIGLSIAV